MTVKEKAPWHIEVRTCPICGEKFVVPYMTDWVYKRRNKSNAQIALCKYSCLVKYDELHPRGNYRSGSGSVRGWED